MSVITGIPTPAPFLQRPGESPIPWKVWKKTFKNYLFAVGLDSTEEIEASRCRALLIACLGTEGQRILFTFDKSSVTTMKDVMKAMSTYFKKVISKWSERVIFSERKQRPNESIESYISDLRELASNCDFLFQQIL